jgi:uncharacterized protein (TIGR02145 family)
MKQLLLFISTICIFIVTHGTNAAVNGDSTRCPVPDSAIISMVYPDTDSANLAVSEIWQWSDKTWIAMIKDSSEYNIRDNMYQIVYFRVPGNSKPVVLDCISRQAPKETDVCRFELTHHPCDISPKITAFSVQTTTGEEWPSYGSRNLGYTLDLFTIIQNRIVTILSIDYGFENVIITNDENHMRYCAESEECVVDIQPLSHQVDDFFDLQIRRVSYNNLDSNQSHWKNPDKPADSIDTLRWNNTACGYKPIHSDDEYSNGNPSYTDSVTDIDGNRYHARRFGSRTWLVEDLKVTAFNTGIRIPYIGTIPQAEANTGSGYHWGSFEPAALHQGGALYSGEAVLSDKLAPSGWHIATNEEWVELITYLGGHDSFCQRARDSGFVQQDNLLTGPWWALIKPRAQANWILCANYLSTRMDLREAGLREFSYIRCVRNY